MTDNQMLEFIIGVLESHSDWIAQQNTRNEALIKIINEQTDQINFLTRTVLDEDEHQPTIH